MGAIDATGEALRPGAVRTSATRASVATIGGNGCEPCQRDHPSLTTAYQMRSPTSTTTSPIRATRR